MQRRSTQGSLTQTVRRLVAYLPATLAADILQHGRVPTPGEPRRRKAATLFCDLVGFTAMTAELAREGPRGAEELNRILLMTFTVMINAIHTARGAVIHFHGDAMLAYFPDDDGEAAQRALACAQFMISLMRRGYSTVTSRRAVGEDVHFELGMRVGVGYGDCVEYVLGDLENSLEFVVGGPAIEEAVAAQDRAEADMVIGSSTVLSAAGLPAAEPFRALVEVLPVPYAPPILFLGSYASPRLRLLVDAATHFVHPTLPERVMGDKSAFVAEHRPVTSMFVKFDGVDFTTPEGGVKLQAYYCWAVEMVRRYGGDNSRLNRVLTGDKGNQLHIFFGAPVAPDAPDQALRCALAMQAEKPAFVTSQRIGLAAGSVFAGAVGSGSRREYTIIGEVVNLSARLVSHCPDGGVVTDPATAQRLADQFQFAQTAPVGLKGFTVSVALFRAVGERAPQPPSRRRSAPLGRREAFEQLTAELDLALNGGWRTTAVVGVVGGDRSRMLGAGLDYWLAHEGLALTAVCQTHLSDVPFAMWQPVWRQFFDFRAAQDGITQAQRLVARVRELCPYDAGDVGLWLDAMGLPHPPGAAAPSALSGEGRRLRFFGLVQRLMAAAALQEPQLLIFEDVHWADELSLALLDFLARQPTGRRVALIYSFAPDHPSGGGAAALAVDTTIRLEDIPTAAGIGLARTLLGEHPLPAPLLRYLRLDNDDTLINPVFLEESVQLLLDTGAVRLGDGLLIDDEVLAGLRVPSSIQSLLLTRLDRLSADARLLLQAAAVAGRQVGREMLRTVVAELSAGSFDAALGELRTQGLIQHSGGGADLLFSNDMIREVAYQSIPYARRQQLHLATADALIGRHAENLLPYSATLAYHYSHTDLREEGLRFAVAAADEALRVDAFQPAIDMYSLAEGHIRALEAAGSGAGSLPATAAHVYLARAVALQQAGLYARAIQDAESARSRALALQDNGRAAQACNLLAELKSREAPGETVLALANEVVQELQRPLPPEQLAAGWAMRGAALAYLGHFEEAGTSFEMAVALYEALETPAGLARTHLLWARDHAAAQGQWTEMAEHLAAAGDCLPAAGSAAADLALQHALGLAELALAREHVEDAAAQLASAGRRLDEAHSGWWRPAFQYLRSCLFLLRADRANAHATLHLALMAIESGGCPDVLPLVLLSLAQLTTRAEQADGYLTACQHAARTRARHVDRVYCLARVSELRAAR